MKLARWSVGAVLTAACFFQANTASAALLGQIDTFEDGTVQNWFDIVPGESPNPFPPVNVPMGGPAGDNDNYLLLRSNGTPEPGGQLFFINRTQWAGNYLAEGITAITMDVNNLGATDLYLRLLLDDSNNGPPSDLAFSLAPVVVPAGSGWTSVVFPLQTNSLIAVLGSVDSALSDTTTLSLYHSPTPTLQAEPIVAELGVDNITVSAVPEPSPLAGLVFAVGGLGLVLQKRSKARQSVTVLSCPRPE